MLCSINSLGNISSKVLSSNVPLSGKAKFSGSNYLLSANSVNILTNTFTIECWYKSGSTSSGVDVGIIGFGSSGAGFGLAYNKSSNGKFSFYNDTGSVNYAGTTTASLNTWYHLVVQRDSSNKISVYVNGVREYYSSAGYSASLSGTYCIGRMYGNLSGNYMDNNSCITAVRMSNIARYSANFTPSTNQIPVTGNDHAVFNFKDSTTFLNNETGGYTLTNKSFVSYSAGFP